MSITYTDKLGLPIVTDGDTDWGEAVRDAMQTLDDNPGIASVADSVAMIALEVWEGRKIFREDSKTFWNYIDSTWTEEVEGEGSSPFGVIGKTDIGTITTGSIAAAGSENGEEELNLYPDVNEACLLLVSVTPSEEIEGFKFRIYGDSARLNLLYELDTANDESYAGEAVRDPNAGFIPVGYLVLDTSTMYYTVYNDDPAAAVTFDIDISYRP